MTGNRANIPRQNSDLGGGSPPSREWYNFFRRVGDFVNRAELGGNTIVNQGDTIINNGTGSVPLPTEELVVVDATTSRTLTNGDAGAVIEFTNSGAVTVNLLSNAIQPMPTGAVIYLLQGGAGQVTVVPGSGVTVDYTDSLKTRTQESMIGLKQIQTDKWELFGDAEPLVPARSALIRSANSAGAPTWVAPSADGQVLKRSSGTLGFSALTAAEVTNTPAGNIAATTVQAALNELDAEKQVVITGGASTITTSNLTASRALVSDGSGKVAVSAATSAEVGHLSGVTSAIQTQLNAKAALNSPALTGNPTAPTAAVGTNTTQLATTAFVNAEIANDAPTKTGDGASGTWGISISGNAATASNSSQLEGLAKTYFVYGDTASGSNLTSATQNVYELAQYKSGFWEANSATWTPDTGWWWGATFAHRSNSGSYNFSGQLAFQSGGGGDNLYARTISNGTPSGWALLLSSGNYNSYAPTLTGTGASGTWGINISGNAATVTNGVYTTGSQTIGGQKVFSTNPIYSNSGFQFHQHQSDHIAFLKKTGAYNWYWIRNDTGLTDGANAVNQMELLDSGSLIAYGDMRAPIFYDANNTAYYLDPANTTTSGVFAGNLGINTSAPAYKLDITTGALGTTAGNEQLIYRSTTNTGNNDEFGIYCIRQSNGNDWTTSDFIIRRNVDGSAGQSQIRFTGDNSGATAFWTGGAERMRIAASGNVIAYGPMYSTIYYDTSNSAYYLDLDSTGTSLNVAGSIVAAGNVTAYSDIRVKANIEPIHGALDKLSQINGVTYTRTDLDDKERRYGGVIAQEIEAVLPEAVFDDGVKKAVDYNATVGLLIEAVKEQQAQINELKLMVHQLKGN